jgi:hypothetical protein
MNGRGHRVSVTAGLSEDRGGSYGYPSTIPSYANGNANMIASDQMVSNTCAYIV